MVSPLIPAVLDRVIAMAEGAAEVSLVLVGYAGREDGKIAEAALN